MIKYKRWVKAKCLVCGNEWLEIWAMIFEKDGKECSEPCLVCPNASCGTLFSPDEYNLSDNDLKAS